MEFRRISFAAALGTPSAYPHRGQNKIDSVLAELQFVVEVAVYDQILLMIDPLK
jgi:hypothetical protein